MSVVIFCAYSSSSNLRRWKKSILFYATLLFQTFIPEVNKINDVQDFDVSKLTSKLVGVGEREKANKATKKNGENRVSGIFRSPQPWSSLVEKEMNNWIGQTNKQLWNFAMHKLHNLWEFDINTTAFCLGLYSLHLLLLKSSMPQQKTLTVGRRITVQLASSLTRKDFTKNKKICCF